MASKVDKALEAAKAAGATHRDAVDAGKFYRQSFGQTFVLFCRDGEVRGPYYYGTKPPESAEKIQ